jgi:hypothetical protein
VEANRVSESLNVACSYRISIDPDGRIFKEENGWPNFHARSKELTESKTFTHVVLADITDFYSQAYHHRIHNALENAKVGSTRAKSIEHFLISLTAKQSRGLPVGPVPSIILAEAYLSDVDSFLLEKTINYTRYVDDFRIFCANRREAVMALHDLTEYLYTAHRLSLTSSKTQIMHVLRFLEQELNDPKEEEEQAKTDKLKDVIAALTEEAGYPLTPDEVTDDLVELYKTLDLEPDAVRESLRALFEKCVSERPLHLGRARYLLRKARQLRTNTLNNLILNHLEVLSPVFRDVALCLQRCLPRDGSGRASLESLMSFLSDSDFGQLRFIQLWGLEVCLSRHGLLTPSEFARLVTFLGVREAALVAQKLKRQDWVRERKEIWNNHGPWDRRAVIWASSVLPRDERHAWLTLVEESGDLLDQAVAIYAAAGTPE